MRSDTGQSAHRASATRIREPGSPWTPANPADGEASLAGIARRCVRDRFPPVMGRRVLELGCGSGDHLAFFLASGAEAVIGVDTAAEAIVRAARRFDEAPADLIVHDFSEPVPMWRWSADLTLVNLTRADPVDLDVMLREARRLTMPGGEVHVLAEHPCATGSDPAGMGAGAWWKPGLARPTADYLRAAERAGLAFRDLHEVGLGGGAPLSRQPSRPAVVLIGFRVYQ